MHMSTRLRPWPPYSGGHCMPIQPRSAILRYKVGSWSSCPPPTPARRLPSSIDSRQNARTSCRNCSCLGVNENSISGLRSARTDERLVLAGQQPALGVGAAERQLEDLGATVVELRVGLEHEAVAAVDEDIAG